MIVGFYSGASAIDYNEQKLATINNNLANLEKPSYKASEFVIKTRKVDPQSRWIHPEVSKRLPPLYGVERKGVYKDFATPGSLRETQNPLNVAIDSSLTNGFFQVRRSDDLTDKEVYYTRNGDLGMMPLDPSNPDGVKVLSASGHIVLGDGGAPIELDPGAGELNISKDGEVYQGELFMGRLPLYRFNKSPDPTQIKDSNLQSLMRLGDSLYKVPPKLEQEFNPIQISLGDSKSGVLMRQGFLEDSNVSIMTEMADMITVNRLAQAGRMAMDEQVSSLEKLFQIVRS